MHRSWIYKSLLRPTRQPSASVPFGVRSVGHYRLHPPFTSNIAVRQFIQLFWCLNGSGTMVIQGVEYPLRVGDVALYMPGMLHKWFNRAEAWEFRWLALDGPLAESIVNAFGLQAAVYHVGPAPVQIFRQIERALRHPSQPSESRACAAAFQILTQASFHQRNFDDPLVKDAITRIHQQWNTSTFNINALANDLHIHRSSLSRRFHQFAGISPIEYTNKIRIQNVLLQLQTTSRTVQEITLFCGYTDPAYVSRLVRQATGLAPKQFRATHQLSRPNAPIIPNVRPKPSGPATCATSQPPKSVPSVPTMMCHDWEDCR